MKRNEERVAIGIILLISLISTVIIICCNFILSPDIPQPVVVSVPPEDYTQQVSSALDSFGININTADLQRLEELPGVGPVIAQRILDYRQLNGPFAQVEDLLQVKGIGEKTLEKILPYIFIG